jgi:RNA polymerase sigma factor (sigma-70 family)
MADDVELLRLYHRNHSEEAFAELVGRHAGFVYGCALRRVGSDRQYAEDVTQAVFTRMAKASATLVQHPVLKGWLYTTTRHLAAATVRAERRRREREQKAYAMNEIMPESDPEPAWAELRPVIDDAFEVLTAREREAVFLRFYEAREYADMRSLPMGPGIAWIAHWKKSAPPCQPAVCTPRPPRSQPH